MSTYTPVADYLEEDPASEPIEDELTPAFVNALIDRIMEFMEVFVGYGLHEYQKPVARRIIESVIINDGEEITAQASRQSGKSETIANTAATLMVLMPRLAKMYPDLLGRFSEGIWIGLFAPVEGQVETLFSRVLTRLTSARAEEILGDPEIDDAATKPGGVVRTIKLKKSGSFVSMMTANPKAKIESRTFHLIIIDECQGSDDTIVQKCYAAGTPIWLPDGTIRPVEEVVAQRLPVLTYDTEWDLREMPGGQPKKGQGRKKDTGNLVGAIPVEWIDNGEQSVWTVTLASGRCATVTANHEWVIRERKGNSHPKIRTTDALEVGMHVPLPRSIDFFGDRLRFDDGYFLGQMLGDGCMSGASPMWCGYPGEVMEEMVRYAARLGTWWRVGKESPDGFQNGAFTKPGNGLNGVTAFLREERVWGHKGRDKRLVRTDYSRDAARGILSGLIDSDGCVSTTNISFANISEELVRQVSDLALKFGAVGYIDKREQNGGFGADPHPVYEVRWKNRDAVIALAEALSLREPRKKERLRRLAEIKEGKVSRRRVATEKRRVLDVQWDRIVEIQYKGVQPTYCVTVEPSHLLIVDGFVCRNSISPMLAYHSGTMVKSGTPATNKNNFYRSIQRNKRRQTNSRSKQHHFEWDWKIVAKANPNYGKFVKKEMLRIGEDSDEFQMCVAPETRVLTADLRHIPASEVREGMELIGFDEHVPAHHQHRKFQTAVVEAVSYPVLPSYRITLSDGTTVVASEDHRWLVRTSGSRTEWRTTKDLALKRYTSKGELPRIIRATEVWEEEPWTYERGYLAAAYDGEGHLSSPNPGSLSIGFSQKEGQMLHRVRKYLGDAGFSTREHVQPHGVSVLYVAEGSSRVAELLGRIRPERLLDKFKPEMLGSLTRRGTEVEHPLVVSVEFLGDRETVAFRTSTRTFIAEGLASHNSYCCRWILERGMFVTEGVMDTLSDKSMEVVKHWHKSPVVVGIDPARKLDSTVVTVVWVDWDRPDEFGYYDHRILNWLELTGEDWEEQYAAIVDFLSNYDILAVAVDANGVGDAVAQRLGILLPRAEVIPVTSSLAEQSGRFKHLQALIQRQMIGWPGHAKTRRLRSWKRFMQQMIDAERNYQGPNFTVAAPDEAWAHDDYVDSLAIAVSLTKEYVMPTIEVSNSPFFP